MTGLSGGRSNILCGGRGAHRLRIGDILLGLAAAAVAAPAWAGTTERVSVGPKGRQGNGGSSSPSLSASGRSVAFMSDATNLVPGDSNGDSDVFVRGVRTRRKERVSVGPGGLQGDDSSGRYGLAISADGRFVAFTSDATNLVPGDTNNARDVFVHERKTGKVERVNLGSRGRQANGGSFSPKLSADGRFVAFSSDASNLVPGDTNQATDVFVRDRQTGKTERVSVGLGGVEGAGYSGVNGLALSADGRFVAFRVLPTSCRAIPTMRRTFSSATARHVGRSG